MHFCNSNTPKVSVIIPVYNAGEYVERCCISLFEQTLDEIEFVFIDDFSSDNSINIIESIVAGYPERRNQVKILRNTSNRGVSFSRQRGLDAASGDYVIHCDSDDWVDRSMYETLYDIAMKINADIVCCGYEVDYQDGNKIDVLSLPVGELKELEFNISPTIGSLCNKIIRTSILREANIKFPKDVNWGEDFCVSISCLLLSKKTFVIQNYFYHYCQNSKSITHTLSKKRCNELLSCGNIIESFLKNHGLIEQYQFQLNYLKFQVKAILLRDRDVRDVKEWVSTYPECNSDVMKYNYSWYFKIVSLLVIKGFPRLAVFILTLMGK